jgi:hypothetical protein
VFLDLQCPLSSLTYLSSLSGLCICVKNRVIDAFLPVFESCVGLPIRPRVGRLGHLQKIPLLPHIDLGVVKDAKIARDQVKLA